MFVVVKMITLGKCSHFSVLFLLLKKEKKSLINFCSSTTLKKKKKKWESYRRFDCAYFCEYWGKRSLEEFGSSLLDLPVRAHIVKVV